MLRVSPVPGNGQRLDGGAMFGNAPRALWSRWCPPDESGRIPLACRAVLVEDGERRVLLETGIGAFFDPKLRDRYGVVEGEHVLLASLDRLGAPHDRIDVVVLSHLHFDHAGGLFAAFEPGAPLRLLFPRATFVVGEEALARARAPHLRDRASFAPGTVELLEASGRLHVVPRGAASSDVLGPRFSLLETSGHTPGMLHATVRGAHGTLFFGADLVPGVPWVRLPITMGYDRFPEHLIDEKAEALAHLADTRGWIAFTHDPTVAFASLRRAADGFEVERSRTDADGALDLDSPG